tara:strand:+ start:579 stop:854 length:276 start_codon:yes stop_codon:yes gene_type:complete
MDIRKILEKGNVKFTVKGITTYCKGEDGEYGTNSKIFEVGQDGESIWSEYHGMNVTKWGPTCVTLYTFDMLGRRSVGKINYREINLIKKNK